MTFFWWFTLIWVGFDTLGSVAKICGWKPEPFTDGSVGVKMAAVVIWIASTAGLVYFLLRAKP